MSKKKQIDKSLILSKENFDKFTKVTYDNVRDYYYTKSIFIVALVVNNSITIMHSFSGRKQHKKGINNYYFLYDNKIHESTFKSDGETLEQYNESMDNFYPYIKQQIDKSTIFAIKINEK